MPRPLTALEPAGDVERFGLHPLQTFSGSEADATRFAGCRCAVAGSTPAAAATAAAARARAGHGDVSSSSDEQRPAYHAAASIASNFLVALEAAAEEVAAAAGLEAEEARAALAPLVRTTVENWAALGPRRALTGPVARGDELTVAAQRAAVREAAPQLEALFDVMVERARALVRGGARMRTVRSTAELREALASAPRPLGLVPTMGAFHDGHLSLIRRAREENATVVVSLFVNPAQFGPNEDFDAYPRDERARRRAGGGRGGRLPVRSSGGRGLPRGLRHDRRGRGDNERAGGGSRATAGSEHFRGVTTVVTKLFNMVGPDRAYFGQKDAQQAFVIRKLVRDLNMPVEIRLCPTVREPSGLAMSSRNAYLSAEERERAAAINRALVAAEDAARAGERDPERVLAVARAVLDSAGIEPEYLELRSTEDLSPVERVNGSTLLAVAARVGRARLIDNAILTTNQSEVP